MHFEFIKYLMKSLAKKQNLKKILFANNYLSAQNILKTESLKNGLAIIFA